MTVAAVLSFAILLVLVLAFIGARVSKSRALGAVVAGLFTVLVLALLAFRFSVSINTRGPNWNNQRNSYPPRYYQEDAQIPPQSASDARILEMQAQAIRQAIESAPVPQLPQIPDPQAPMPVDGSPRSQASPAVSSADASAKLWVQDWAKFVNTTRSGQLWLRAQSNGTWATEAEARADARRQATAVLMPYLATQARARGISGISNAIEQDLISRFVMNGWLVADEHLERTSRPYAELWSCSLLLDASPRKLAVMVQTLQGQVHEQTVSRQAGWVSLAGVVVVILLVYAFLNIATRGYYVWRLRTAAILMSIVGVLAALALLVSA